MPDYEGRTGAPLDSRKKGVIRRTIPKHDFDKIADKRNFTHMQAVAPPVHPGQSGRQLPKNRT